MVRGLGRCRSAGGGERWLVGDVCLFGFEGVEQAMCVVSIVAVLSTTPAGMAPCRLYMSGDGPVSGAFHLQVTPTRSHQRTLFSSLDSST